MEKERAPANRGEEMVANEVQVRRHQRRNVRLSVWKIAPPARREDLQIAIVLYRFPHDDELALNQIGCSVAGRIFDEFALSDYNQHRSMAEWNQESFQHNLDVVVASHRGLVAPLLEVEFARGWIPSPVGIEPAAERR